MKTSPFFVKRNYLLLAILISGTASASSVVPFSVSGNLAAPLEVVAEQTQNSLDQQTVKTFLNILLQLEPFEFKARTIY